MNRDKFYEERNKHFLLWAEMNKEQRKIALENLEKYSILLYNKENK